MRKPRKAIGDKRADILAAATDAFFTNGFDATSMEAIATQANVAKGTLYLYFRNKQDLFEAMVRSILLRPDDLARDLPFHSPFAETAVDHMAHVALQGMEGRPGAIFLLLISEAIRHPQIAEFYYREVLEPGLAVQRELLERAEAAGELRDPRLAEFPQLLDAPMLFATIWQSLFSRFAPLDARKMLEVHFSTVFTRPDQRDKAIV